jgi:hypothetical protein
VKIATCADFCGTRWTVNAVLMQTPKGVSYLTPAGSVMRLFGKYNGRQGVAVASAPSNLDIAASRTDGKVFLHVANTSYEGSTLASLAVQGMPVRAVKIRQIAPPNPREAVTQDDPNIFQPKETSIPGGPSVEWRFPARSVSVLELDCG